MTKCGEAVGGRGAGVTGLWPIATGSRQPPRDRPGVRSSNDPQILTYEYQLSNRIVKTMECFGPPPTRVHRDTRYILKF